MKLKNFIFVTFFLAAASLGSALPSKNTKSPGVKIPTTNNTHAIPTTNNTHAIPTTNNTQVISATSSTQSSINTQTEQVILDAAKDVSKECATALVTIATSPEFLKCVPLSALLPLAPIVTDPDTIPKFLADPANVYKNVLEKPLITFADTICAAPKCDDKAVAGAVQLLEQQCQKDLNNQFIQTILATTIFYSPTRDTLCLKDQAKKDLYCWDETLLGVVQLPKSPFEITKIPLVDSIAVADPQAVCTSCPQQIIVGIFFKFIQGNDAAKQFLASQKIKIEELEAAVAVKCGANFLNPNGKNKEEL